MPASDNLTSLRERLQGYKEALAAANIPFNERLVRYGVDSEQSGYEKMLNLLDEGLAFSAVFALNDAVALGAMAAVHERGLKIPQSIAVAGFDDNPFAAYLNPSLTSVKLPFKELGRLAGEMLVNLINEQAKPGLQVTVPVQLVIRKSTAPKI
jgi:LacI family transcriptional regulator